MALPNITLKSKIESPTLEVDRIFDNEWIKSTFLINDADIKLGSEYKKWIRVNRYFSSADFKFTSSSPGMSLAVNPKPQFTRYADIRSKGRLKNRPPVTLSTTSYPYGLGMGRYYSEAIDDNEQRIFLRFGVPSYTPIFIWLSRAFDIDRAVLQNRGVITQTLYELTNAVSKLFAVLSAPLLAVGMYLFNVFVDTSRFYSFKDTMYIYWATVDDILNSLVARRTLLPFIFKDYTVKLDNRIGAEQTVKSDLIAELNKQIPSVVDAETGRISVFALALRSQRAYNKMLYDDLIANENTPFNTDFKGYQYNNQGFHDTYFTYNTGSPTWVTKNLLQKAFNALYGRDDKIDSSVNSPVDTGTNKPNDSLVVEFDKYKTDENGNPMTLIVDPNDPRSSVDQQIQDNVKNKSAFFKQVADYMLAELTEGGAFAVFNVDYTGSVGESFSSSLTENPIQSAFNSISSTIRQGANFIHALDSIPIIGDAVQFVLDGTAKIISNATFGLANPLLAALYGVNVSMPKIWADSNVNFPRASYKMHLFSPYGNAYSQLFNIYLPLSMILAASLPRATGLSTYTSPFMCQLYDRGRVTSTLSMITDVSVTRGTSNLGFTRSGHPNAIDIDFTITSLDEIVSVDIASNGLLMNGLKQFDPNVHNTPFTDYLSTVAGVDVYTQVYKVPKARLSLAERYMKLNAIITNPDPAAWGMFTVDKIPLAGDAAKLLFGSNSITVNDLFNR